jgi:hypothetical protein
MSYPVYLESINRWLRHIGLILIVGVPADGGEDRVRFYLMWRSEWHRRKQHA